MDYTIAMFPKIQGDTAIAYFLLNKFGESKFPGIKDAKVEFWMEMPEDKDVDELEQEGYILLDMGGGEFDHHKFGPDNKQITSSYLIAEHLGIEDRPDLQKLIEFARRDDLEGKGTVSIDPIDRAFGLAGLLTALNKTMREHPRKILDIIIPLLEGHYIEENRRHELLPEEYQSLLKAGKVKEFRATQGSKEVKTVYIETDSPTMAGYLRSKAIGADLVIQKASTGHVNFVTRQRHHVPRLELRKLVRLIKLLEAQKNGLILKVDSVKDLELPGRTEGLPHWYYDTRANTIQNGGLSPQGIPSTKLTYDELEKLVKEGMNIERDERKFHQESKRGNNRHHGVQYL